MQKFYLPLFLLALVVLEGVALDFIPNISVLDDLLVIPHWLLVFLVMVAVFYDQENTYFSIVNAILFGLLIDVVYTSVIGVYMFVYALTIYLIHGLSKLLHTNYFVVLLMTIIAVGIADIGIYFIYFFIGTMDIFWEEYMMTRLIPTILANILFFLICYPIVKRKLVKWSIVQFDRKK
ncbi:rod shape-determining protein MreD [Aquibacillus halophilus]|uniref:Rod shape-determining protein MreD n=1 Tax=Aquibacillus halophilus TaxID=930132 RepID=A0A6A8DJ42_9BACI|nr:rod shape-determining protein MreD [Aquibacillus halophilus]MRH42977.1 rod shape-determining protein MreD [Aquibacillus halophilus]